MYELKTRDYFEALGYRCQLAPNPSKWAVSNDFYHLWDMVAVNEVETIWCQIKLSKANTYGKALDAHRAWVVPPSTRKLLVTWIKGAREPEITELTDTKIIK